MRLKITGKNITLTEGIKSAVKDKIKKIEKLVGDDAAVDVMLSAKHGKAKGQRAEITVKTKSSVVRAEVTDEDLYRAINSALSFNGNLGTLSFCFSMFRTQHHINRSVIS